MRSSPRSRRTGFGLSSLAAIAVAMSPATGWAQTPVPGSVAFDYRNRPDVAKLVDFETVVLSPNALQSAAALHARGQRALFWLQPFLCPWQGRPPAAGMLLGDAYALAESRGAWLRDGKGEVARIRDVDVADCRVYDFRDSAFVEALARLVADRLQGADGVLLDYGCPSLGWEPSLGAVQEEVWEAWSAGHMRYLDALRRRRPAWRILCQCQRWGRELPARCDGLVLEKVGWSLNPYEQVLAESASQPEKRSVLLLADAIGHEDPVRRRVTAALSLLLGHDFAYRREDAFGPHASRDPEHFELVLGAWRGPPREVRSGVYLREAEFGWVVVNLSPEPYRHGEATISARDALTAQTRDPATGGEIPWRTGDAP